MRGRRRTEGAQRRRTEMRGKEKKWIEMDG